MTVRSVFEAVQPFFIGIGVTVILAVLPLTCAQGRDIQKISDSLDTIKTDTDSLKKSVDDVDRHERQSETDPDKLVAKVLGVSKDLVSIGTVSWVGDSVVVFPKTDNDTKKLVDAGLHAQARHADDLRLCRTHRISGAGSLQEVSPTKRWLRFVVQGKPCRCTASKLVDRSNRIAS